MGLSGKCIRLRDGRSLGYAETGDPDGKPVFFFHGLPGSRLVHHPDESIAISLGARVIAIDRPGFGLSDFQPGRRVLNWPDDIIELADALGIARFAVAGWSAGGPYVAACTFKIPHRVSAAAIISGVAPLNRLAMRDRAHLFFNLARQSPHHAAASFWLLLRAQERALKHTTALLPTADRAVLAQPEIAAMRRENVAEAVRAGMGGLVWETALLARPWGFRLEDVPIEVHLWHGGADINTPVSMGQYLAGAIPRCHARFVPAEGHWLLFAHWREILTVLVAGSR
ncbi:MAG: alpha/beta hydrolase [Anaerolineae bacterium]|nr:alpha/beta hydrolase [Anaerolineae bacterium]